MLPYCILFTSTALSNSKISVSPSQLVGCIRTVKTTTWFEEHLTEENQDYMRKIMAEEYRKQTKEKLFPLKDEPWPRQEWTEGTGHFKSRFLSFILLLLTFFICVLLRKQKSWVSSCEVGHGSHMDKIRGKTCSHNVTGNIHSSSTTQSP